MDNKLSIIAVSLICVSVTIGLMIGANQSEYLSIVLGSSFIALLSFYLFRFSAINPLLFWILVFTISIGASGLLIRGLSFTDEYLLTIVLLGAISSKKVFKNIAYSSDKFHLAVFLLLLVYLIFQSFRGLIELVSLRKVRWIIFFIILATITVQGKKIPSLSSRKTSFIVTLTTSIYLGVYISYGLIGEQFGIDRYDLQFAQTGYLFAIWGTTAYALFPIAIAVPAALYIVNDSSRLYRRIGWCTILLSVFSALYYDSRIALLAIMLFILLCVPNLGFRKSLIIFVSTSLLLFMFLSIFWSEGRDFNFFVSDVFGSANILWKTEDSGIARDRDRYVHLRVAFTSISASWQNFLFGYGYRMSGFIIGPYLNNLEYIYTPKSGSFGDNVGTTAFTGFVIDNGIIGILLLITNFGIVIFKIYRYKQNSSQNIFIASSLVIMGWLFVINILDMTLLFITIMPSGLLSQLGYSNSKLIRMQYPKNHTGQDPLFLPANRQRIVK